MIKGLTKPHKAVPSGGVECYLAVLLEAGLWSFLEQRQWLSSRNVDNRIDQ